jgi:hypothetical protein
MMLRKDNKGQDMKKLIYRGHELDERIWFRIKNDQDFKKMLDDCLDDLYQPERSKREDAIKECKELGHVNTWMPKNQVLCMRCGALNTMET